MEISKPCAFILTIRTPLSGMQAICKLLLEKEVKVESMQLLIIENGTGRLVVNCKLVKDRTAYIGQCLEKLDDVLEAEWINLRFRQKRFS